MALQWSSALETGFAQVDAEHKRLIDELNKLGNAIETGAPSPEQLRAALVFLGTYAKTHFANEERCMAENACPSAAANKAAHAQFLKSFSEAQKKINGPSPLVVAQTLHKELCSWVRAHILSVDLHLRKCAKSRLANHASAGAPAGS